MAPEGSERHRKHPAKRVLDMALCLALLPLAAVVMAVIALAIVCDTPGPIFFVQQRVGRGGCRFQIYKFRTIKREWDDSASREFMKAFVMGRIGQDGGDGRRSFKALDKAPVTHVGRVLRRTSLDELPQIWNVLRGEMSLVGPRPNVPWEVDAYQEWHKERLKVLPGMTGLAQVRGRSGLPFDVSVQYDIEYVRKQSLKLDLQILCWTVLTVLSGRGAG